MKMENLVNGSCIVVNKYVFIQNFKFIRPREVGQKSIENLEKFLFVGKLI